MCIADNSPDLYTTTCPMCKHFRHTARCPHKREICRNRVNHPRHDVVFISNAEVSTFKGCGYCKWATAIPSPPPNKSGMHNPGWPGCCRPPQSSEFERIPPADWLAVHNIHRTPIPPDIKQLLDAVKVPSYGSSATSPTSPSNLNAIAAATASTKDASRALGGERKSLSRANSSPNGSVRSPPQKIRTPVSGTGSGNSPQMKQARLAGGAQPGTSPAANAVSPTGSLPSNPNSLRRGGPDAQKPLKRVEGFRTTPPTSMRKLNVEGEQQQQQHSTTTRTSLASVDFSAGTPEREQAPSKRRGSTSTTAVPLAVATNRVTATPKATSKPLDRDSPKLSAEKEKSENTGLEKGLKTLNLSSSSDSGSDSASRSSSNDTSTVTSDGGFTDYLSDESEAELQRQAEIRAALLEQNRVEEQEFRAARRQLASVDLRPPQAWTTGRKAINTHSG
ncbi:uncharacterized protein FOMMEDRAFT_169558 [Fomitiporia mediterranea MF3/22]|uniref:uncharacterized protein n=1 Tax=Fomitiporia mediterranea (strain MF3/22) TaxID=694068 RepID=UPI0004409A97|nr:uncharacterized protein FOMMEDRAFT_169558 [Fomitiporia mediterranea MF3/22]EJD01437.1 hypothetical protein FOMMEDRAFT_169558 [Fomitiporia mediterranea MF3/22]